MTGKKMSVDDKVELYSEILKHVLPEEQDAYFRWVHQHDNWTWKKLGGMRAGFGTAQEVEGITNRLARKIYKRGVTNGNEKNATLSVDPTLKAQTGRALDAMEFAALHARNQPFPEKTREKWAKAKSETKDLVRRLESELLFEKHCNEEANSIVLIQNQSDREQALQNVATEAQMRVARLVYLLGFARRTNPRVSASDLFEIWTIPVPSKLPSALASYDENPSAPQNQPGQLQSGPQAPGFSAFMPGKVSA